jgi:hypothetical protein
MSGLSYVEAGRFFVATNYKQHSTVLLQLMRAGITAAMDSGHQLIIGMVSYNHLKHTEELNQRFLAELICPPYSGELLAAAPNPRYPILEITNRAPRMTEQSSNTPYQDLQRSLQQYEPEFRLPIIMRKYASFANAKVSNFSIARDFNQVTEILMYSDVRDLTPGQRSRLIVKAHNQNWQNP